MKLAPTQLDKIFAKLIASLRRYNFVA